MLQIMPGADGDYHIGTHRFRFDAPDIWHIRLHGEVTPEQFDQFYAMAMSLVPDRPVYLIRQEVNEGLFGSKTRARIIQIVDPQRVAAIVSCGASFHRRVLVMMLIRAFRAVKQSAPEMVFVESESEARAWVDAHRSRTK